MPALQRPRQAVPLDAWSSSPIGRSLLLAAEAAWREEDAVAAGQVRLRLLPELKWPLRGDTGRFGETWTLAPDIDGWRGAWRADLNQLPIPNGAVSRVELRFVLESVPQPETLLSEAARVLHPEGRLLVFGLNPYGAARLRWAKHGLAALSRQRVASVLGGSGLDILSNRAIGPCWAVPATSEAAPTSSRFGFGRVAWAILATRRESTGTLLRLRPARWRSTLGVPAR